MTNDARTESEDWVDEPDAASDEGAGGASQSAHAEQADGEGSWENESPTPEEIEEELVEEELEDDMDSLQSEFNELNDRHLRLAAEFQNFRRRQATEMSETWNRAQADLVRKLLDVLDDLQRVALLDPADEAVTVEAIVEGIDLVERKFLRALEEAGVETLDPVGEVFDPETMEAMMKVPTDSDELDDRVADVFQKGFLLKKHLIRAARVSVHKAE